MVPAAPAAARGEGFRMTEVEVMGTGSRTDRLGLGTSEPTASEPDGSARDAASVAAAAAGAGPAVDAAGPATAP